MPLCKQMKHFDAMGGGFNQCIRTRNACDGEIWPVCEVRGAGPSGPTETREETEARLADAMDGWTSKDLEATI